MRLCAFLAVLLSLVLSLSKGQTTETTPAPTATTIPATTGQTTETTPAPTATTIPATTGQSTEKTPAPTTAATTATTGQTTETTPAPTATTIPATTGQSTEKTPAPTTAATAATTGQSTEKTPAPTTAATTATTGDFCKPDPCGENLAKCVALYSTFTCLCPYGFYYNNKDCHRGKIYPGVITLEGFYTNNVETVNSMEYEKVFQYVMEFFQDAFKDLEGFGQTVIVGIRTLKETRASSSMHVTVTNLFMENSTVEKETVSSAIRNATENSTYVSDYRDETYCAAFNCDAQTTVCEGDMFPECTCRPDFSKTEWDDRSCSDCSKDCSAEQNKYCVKENGIPTCKCMSNFEWKNEKCVSCPVGYSGENCSDNRELILIIVGTVFGAIILMLVIAVSVVSVRAKHKQDPEKMNLIKSGYSNPNTSDDRQTMMFPRVQTTSGHANPGYQPNNPYEMPSANRGHFPERDYDDLYEISKEPEGFRRQNRH